MIKISDVLSEFARIEKFNINVVNDNGISFCYEGINFGIVSAPMFGVPDGHIGLIINKNSYPLKDSYYSIADPDVFDKLNIRIKEFCSGKPPTASPYSWQPLITNSVA